MGSRGKNVRFDLQGNTVLQFDACESPRTLSLPLAESGDGENGTGKYRAGADGAAIAVLDCAIAASDVEIRYDYSAVNVQSVQLAGAERSVLAGAVLVQNIAYEKLVQVKFTFNHWRDIHYVTAAYKESLNSQIDEFEFRIDLHSYKYLLYDRGILVPGRQPSECPLTMEFCCRYDVGGATYYDNNHYMDYTVHLQLLAEMYAWNLDPGAFQGLALDDEWELAGILKSTASIFNEWDVEPLATSNTASSSDSSSGSLPYAHDNFNIWSHYEKQDSQYFSMAYHKSEDPENVGAALNTCTDSFEFYHEIFAYH